MHFSVDDVGKKCVIIGVGAYYLLMSQDKSFQLPRYDPGEVIAAKDKIMRQQSKTLILIRHGESIWNEVFNRGINWKLPFRLMYALCRETVLFVTSDSVLYDSPLSTVGITQAKQIRQSIVSAYDTNNKGASTTTDNETQASLRAQYLDILRNAKAGNSLIVSSPLRRCIETVSLGLFDRMNDSKERIVLHSALQEMTRNIDGVSLSYEYERPPLSLSMRGLEDEFDVDWEQWFDERIVADQKAGFKSPHRRGDDRMRSFVSWMFQQPQDTFIVSGHSLWNRFFFQAYLPRTLQHRGKVQKIANGGVIAVKLMEIKVQPGLTRYVIDADSIVPIVKDFERKKIKSKKRS
eukprot:CAMPEP_0202693924 /NCGR_PEP_ID=MMETSP1385-20130828/7921_1 /ASSEMBLY_ACC=CAM_ASM_000861 /TAXON_ID=933848 /ORGANISM="Elphidium margaritaceum" /LENGTH=348 /DNA_ID=CAMNT_0049349685 /DNA_START=153 /DNA_END=1200 /DNA_ORIENTATION=+